MVIAIGPGAIDRTSTSVANYTCITFANPANGTGTLDTFEIWFKATASGVKIGTLYGSDTSYTSRDSEIIGNVTAGSKQTFTGLNCDVTTGDYIGFYMAIGVMERSTTGGGRGSKAGDQFGLGVQTYTLANGDYSLYGTGTEAAGSITVTTGVIAQSLTKYIPVLQHKIIGASSTAQTLTMLNAVTGYGYVPSTASTATTKYAPVLKFGIIPPTLDQILTEYEPTIIILGNITVTPDLIALVTSAFTPPLKFGIISGLASLATTKYAPILDTRVMPSQLAQVLTEYIPILGTKVTPSTLPQATTKYSPVLKLGVTPITGTLATSSFIPSPNINFMLIPATLALDIVTFASVLQEELTVMGIIPKNASLLLTIFAPIPKTWETSIPKTGRYGVKPTEAWSSGVATGGRYG